MASDDKGAARPAGPVVLRIKLRYEDVDTMVQRFAPNTGKSGLFLPTKSIQPIGTEIKFELRLANDAPVLVGLGKVRHVRAPDPQKPKAAFGMAIELMRVTREGRELIIKMLDRRRQLGLPEVMIPLPEDVDAAKRADSDSQPRGDASGVVREALAGMASAPVAEQVVLPGSAPASGPIAVAVTAAPARTAVPEVLTAPRRPSGPMAAVRGATDERPAAPQLAPEPARRRRPQLADVIAKASELSGAAAAAVVPELDEQVDVARALLRARTLAAAGAGDDLDAQLADLRDSAAAPIEIGIEAASAELARQLGGRAIAPRDRSGNTRWATPPATVAEIATRLPDEEELRARAESDARVRAEQEARARAEAEARANDERAERARAEARARADAEARAQATAAEAAEQAAEAAEQAAAEAAEQAAEAAEQAAAEAAEQAAEAAERAAAEAAEQAAEAAEQAAAEAAEQAAAEAAEQAAAEAAEQAAAEAAEQAAAEQAAQQARSIRPLDVSSSGTINLDAELEAQLDAHEAEIAAREFDGDMRTPIPTGDDDAFSDHQAGASTAVDPQLRARRRSFAPGNLDHIKTEPSAPHQVPVPVAEDPDLASFDQALDAAILHTGEHPSAPPGPDDDDDDAEQLDSLDVEPVDDGGGGEPTQIGSFPVDPQAFQAHGYPTIPDELADQLDQQLAEAEHEADHELAIGIRAESEAGLATVEADPDSYAPEGEEISDLDVLAEADASDADLLLADGEADASDQVAVPVASQEDFATRLDFDEIDEAAPAPSQRAVDDLRDDPPSSTYTFAESFPQGGLGEDFDEPHRFVEPTASTRTRRASTDDLESALRDLDPDLDELAIPREQPASLSSRAARPLPGLPPEQKRATTEDGILIDFDDDE